MIWMFAVANWQPDVPRLVALVASPTLLEPEHYQSIDEVLGEHKNSASGVESKRTVIGEEKKEEPECSPPGDAITLITDSEICSSTTTSSLITFLGLPMRLSGLYTQVSPL